MQSITFFKELCSNANKRRYKWIYATIITLKVVTDSVTDNALSGNISLGLRVSFLFFALWGKMSSLPSSTLTVFKAKNAHIQTTTKHQDSLLKKIRSGIGLKLKIPEHYQFLGFAYSVCLTHIYSFSVCKIGIISTFPAKHSSVKKALQWTNLPNVSQGQQRSPVCSIH